MQKEKTILIYADASRNVSPRDENTSAALRFRRGDTITLDALLMMDGIPIDEPTFRNATLEILDIGALNAPSPRPINILMWKRLEEIEKIECDADGSIPKGAKHLRFTFTKEESAIDSGEKWIRIYADFEGAKRITFAGGWIYVDENYGAEHSCLPIESPEFIGRSEMEEIYCSKKEIEEIKAYIEAQVKIAEETSASLTGIKFSVESAAVSASTSATSAENSASEANAANAAMQTKIAEAQAEINAKVLAAEASKSAAEVFAINAEYYKAYAEAAATTVSDKAELAVETAESALSEISLALANGKQEIQNTIDPDGYVRNLAHTKSRRDGMTLDGGSCRVIGTQSGFNYSAPISFLVTLDIRKVLESALISNVIFNSYSRALCGIYLLYQQSTQSFIVGYGRGSDDFYFRKFTFPDKGMTGLHTFALTISGEFSTAAFLKTNLWKDGVVNTDGAAGSRVKLTSVDIPQGTAADLRLGGATGSSEYQTNWWVDDTNTGMNADMLHFAAYKRVLSYAEIAAYNTSGTVPAGAAINLEQSAYKQWRDETDNGFHAGSVQLASGLKRKDVFVNSDTGIWTASGTKYFISSTEKVLPDNCRFNAVLTASAACVAVLKNGAGTQIASASLQAGVPHDLGNFINTNDGKLSITPSISSVTIKTNLEIRKL